MMKIRTMQSFISSNEDPEILFWVGCAGSYDERYKKVTKSFVNILNKLKAPTDQYAGGWIVVKRSWGKGFVLTHSGSNTMWYTVVWVAPRLNRAFIVATNSKDENSRSICDKLIGKLIKIDNNNVNI